MDAYFGYDRNDMFSNQPNQDKNLAWTMLKIPGLDTTGLSPSRQAQQNGMPLMAIDGFTTLGPANQYQPQRYRDPERNYDASINWQKGAHNFRGGFKLTCRTPTRFSTRSSETAMSRMRAAFTLPREPRN